MQQTLPDTLLLLTLWGQQGAHVTFNSFFSSITLLCWSHPTSTLSIPAPPGLESQ